MRFLSRPYWVCERHNPECIAPVRTRAATGNSLRPEACRDSARLPGSQLRSMRNLPRSTPRPLPKLLTQPPPPWKLPLLPLPPPLPLPKPQNSHWCLRSLRGKPRRLPKPLLRQPRL